VVVAGVGGAGMVTFFVSSMLIATAFYILDSVIYYIINLQDPE